MTASWDGFHAGFSTATGLPGVLSGITTRVCGRTRGKRCRRHTAFAGPTRARSYENSRRCGMRRPRRWRCGWGIGAPRPRRSLLGASGVQTRDTQTSPAQRRDVETRGAQTSPTRGRDVETRGTQTSPARSRDEARNPGGEWGSRDLSWKDAAHVKGMLELRIYPTRLRAMRPPPPGVFLFWVRRAGGNGAHVPTLWPYIWTHPALLGAPRTAGSAATGIVLELPLSFPFCASPFCFCTWVFFSFFFFVIYRLGVYIFVLFFFITVSVPHCKGLSPRR